MRLLSCYPRKHCLIYRIPDMHYTYAPRGLQITFLSLKQKCYIDCIAMILMDRCHFPSGYFLCGFEWLYLLKEKENNSNPRFSGFVWLYLLKEKKTIAIQGLVLIFSFLAVSELCVI